MTVFKKCFLSNSFSQCRLFCVHNLWERKNSKIVFKALLHSFVFLFSQVEEARKLDRRQKEVLFLGLHYAKRLVTYSAPTSPSVSRHFQTSSSSFSVSRHFQTSSSSFSVNQHFQTPSMISPGPSSSATFSANFNLLSSKPSPPLVIVHGVESRAPSRTEPDGASWLYNMWHSLAVT